jgi:hypothetical protein
MLSVGEAVSFRWEVGAVHAPSPERSGDAGRTARAIKSLPLSESLALSEAEWGEWANRPCLSPIEMRRPALTLCSRE